MSSVDERIVNMKFDNAQFESGVKTTLESLDNLKKGLDFSGIQDGVSALQKRFSTMGIVGMELTRKITDAAIGAAKKLESATIGQIKSGGMTRALNIEQARFQLQGLFTDAKKSSKQVDAEVEKVMGAALNAVRGTAYGLDEAAKSASVLAASGVGMKDMEPVLTSIAGAAAMTGRNYEDIGNIYSTVASNGKLMTMQLRQFSAAGLNVSAVLAKHYHKTEEEINKMVEKGQVSFEDFSKAMLNFGTQAKRANETFTGSLANMKAALSRIGAMFSSSYNMESGAKGYIENMRDLFVSLTGFIDKAGEAIKPFAQNVQKLMTYLTKGATRLIDFFSTDTKEQAAPILDLTNGLLSFAYDFFHIIAPIKTAFREMFPEATLENLGKAVILFNQFAGRVSDKIVSQTGNIKDGWAGLFIIFRAIGDVFKYIISLIEAITAPFGGLITIIGTIIGTLGRFLQTAYGFFNSSPMWKNTLNIIRSSLFNASKAVHDFFTSSKTLAALKGIIGGVKTAFEILGNVITAIVDKIKGSGFFNTLGQGLSKIKGFVKGIIDSFKTKDFSSVGENITKFSDYITNSLGKFAEFLRSIDVGKALRTALGGGLISALIGLKDAFHAISRTIVKDVRAFSLFPTTLIDISKSLKYNLDTAATMAQAKVLLVYAASILVLSFAIKQLAKIDAGSLLKGLITVGVLLRLLNEQFNIIKASVSGGFNKGIFKTAASLLLVAFAIKSLSGSVEALGKIDATKLAKGLISVKVLLMSLSAFLTNSEFKGFGISKGLGLVLVAESLRVMSKAVESFGNLNVSQLAKGLSSVAILLAAISGSLRLAGNPKHMIAMGTGLVLMAAAMLIFYKAVEKFGNMPLDSLIVGLLGFVTALVSVSMVINATSPGKALAFGTSLLIMSVGLLAIAASLKILGNMSIEQVLTGLLGLVGALAALALVAKLVNPFSLIATSAGLVIFAAAIMLLTPSLMAFSQLSLESIGKALLLLAGTMLVFGVAAALLTPIAPMLFVLSAALIVFGAGITLIGVGLMAIATAFATLAVSAAAGATALVTALGIIVVGITELIPAVATTLAEGFITFITVVTSHTAELVNAFTNLGLALLNAIKNLIPAMVDTGLALIAGLLAGIASNIGAIAEMSILIIAGLITGIARGIGPIIQAGIMLMAAFIIGLANGIRANSELFFAAVRSLLEAVLEMFLDAMKTIAETIPVVGDKIAKGLDKAKDVMRDTMKVDETNKMLDEGMTNIENTIDEHTGPIKDKFGDMKDGMLSGFDGLGDQLGGKGSDALNQLMGSMTDKIPGITDASGQIDLAALSGVENLPEEFQNMGFSSGAELAEALGSNTGSATANADKLATGALGPLRESENEAAKSGKNVNKNYADNINPNAAVKSAAQVGEKSAKALEAAKVKAGTAGKAFTTEYKKGIESNKSQASTAGKSISNQAASGTNNQAAYNSANTAGLNLGQGLVNGLNAKKTAAYDAGYALGKAAADGQKAGAKERSPSKIAIQTGKYLGEGLIIGINSMISPAYKAGYNIGEKASNALTDAMSKVYDVLNSEIDSNPKITPVIDLTAAKKGIGQLDSMLSNKTISTAALAGKPAIGMMGFMPANSRQDTTNNNVTNTFNITVDGAENPEAFADRLLRQVNMKTRMGMA